MIRITKYDVDKIKLELGSLRKKAPTVISRALNRAAITARMEIVSQTKENYWVKSTEVRKTITISKSTKSKLQTIVKSRASRRELIHFKVSPKIPRHKKPPKILKVAVKKDGGLKELLNAFVAKGTSSGKLHVFSRISTDRYPIQIKYGPSVPEMIGQNLSKRKYKSFIDNKVMDTYQKRLEHEIKRLLDTRGQ